MTKQRKLKSRGKTTEKVPRTAGAYSERRKKQFLAALKKADRLRERIRKESGTFDVVQLIKEVRESR